MSLMMKLEALDAAKDLYLNGYNSIIGNAAYMVFYTVPLNEIEIALWYCNSACANPIVLAWDVAAAYLVIFLETRDKGENNNTDNNNCNLDDDTRSYTMYSALRERVSTLTRVTTWEWGATTGTASF